MAEGLQQGEGLARHAQVEQGVVRSGAADHLGLEAFAAVGAQAHRAAGLGRLAGAHMGQQLAGHARRGGQHALDQGLDAAAGGLLAMQAGLEHPGVVEHQQVAGLEQAGQFAEDPVHRAVAAAIEQAGGAALGGGLLRDQFGGRGNRNRPG
jgi:hypothetical protein